MICYVLAGAIIGTIVAFSIPKTYKTTVILAPEESKRGFSGSISSLASMVGMNLKVEQGGDAIYPEIYPDVLGSIDFLVPLFSVQITTRDGKYSSDYATYLRTKTKFPWWTYPGKILGKLIGKIREEKETPPDDKGVDPFRLTRREWALAKAIKKRIDCSVDKKTNVITIKVADQDPFISACMADTIQARLQTLIVDYRTHKARNDVRYLEHILLDIESQYESARSQYANYVEAHSSSVRESVRQQADRLKSDLQLKENVYNGVVQQLQIARAKVQEDTPVFTAIQSASTPVKASNRSKQIVIAFWMFLAFVARCGVLAWKKLNV